MRKLFDDEVAQYLGYQKYWPEKKDWALAILGCLGVGVVFVLILCGILMTTGNWDRKFQPNPCANYSDTYIGSVPAKCADYFNIRVQSI